MAITPLVTNYMRTTVEDATGIIADVELPPVKYGLGVPGGAAPVDTELVCPAGVFTAAVIPAGARAVKIRPGTAVSLVLKSLTGDATGISITPATNPIGDDLYLTLGAAPTFGFLNQGATSVTIRLVFF